MSEKRKVEDRRNRIDDRRQRERRLGERREGGRRRQTCPKCGSVLDRANYCSTCKIRVIRVR